MIANYLLKKHPIRYPLKIYDFNAENGTNAYHILDTIHVFHLFAVYELEKSTRIAWEMSVHYHWAQVFIIRDPTE